MNFINKLTQHKVSTFRYKMSSGMFQVFYISELLLFVVQNIKLTVAHNCHSSSKLLTAIQIDCNDNKNLTSKSNSPHHKQDADSTNENSHSTNQNSHSTNENSHSTNQNSHSTNENAHSTTKSRRFIVPLSGFEERGNHLAVAGEDLCRSS